MAAAQKHLQSSLGAVLDKPVVSNEDVVEAVEKVEKKLKRKGQSKLITFHDVSIYVHNSTGT